MKKMIITIAIVFISTVLFSQSFYWYQGKKIDLKADSTTFVVQLDKLLIEKQNTAFKEKLQKGEIEFFQQIPNNRFLVVAAKLHPENYDYFSNVYRNTENGIVIILPRIVVMFKEGNVLQPVLDKYEGKLIKESGSNQKFILKCNVVHSEEVLQLVNEINSRNDVVWCEPEFLSDYKVDNTLYPQQYYLNNTGQYGGTAGIDINAEPAWNITNGNSGITVAVIDAGVDRDHEDMGTRVLEGFTIRNATGDGEPQNANDLDTKAHGMACAGIVAASNNTIGIRGVASNVNVLPINIVPDAAYIDWLGRTIQGFGTNIEIAEAINWAWRRADVLSCSWGGGDPSNDITTAIDSARTFGRNGNGSVVVFSSGNYYPDVTDVLYPGRLNGVITVGAITNQGIICNFSQRGTSMDLVAPTGDANSYGNITTTDRMGDLGYNSGNYMNNFGGTSAACPQVSGVAALMLSIRPDLTEPQVRTILQNTARDLGPAGFDNTYGYGLVDAHAAIRAALMEGVTISGPTSICGQTTYIVENLPQGTSVVWSASNCNIELYLGQGTDTAVYRNTGINSSEVQAFIILNSDTIGTLSQPVNVCQPYISGPSTICTSSATFNLYDLPPVSSITWKHGSGLTISSGQNTTSCTFSTSENGAVSWVTAELDTDCGSVTLPSKPVQVGADTPAQINGFEYNGKEFAGDFIYQFGVSSLGVTDYQWSVGGGTIISGQGTDQITVRTAEVTGQIPIYFDVAVRVKSWSCPKWSAYFIRNGLIVPGDGGITIAPNPTNGETTLSIESASSEKTFDETAPWDLEVYSETQLLKTKQTGLHGQSAKIQTAGWQEGIYIVRVNYNDEILTGKLVVKK